MSNVQNNETKASAAAPKHRAAPDGKSQLPDSLTDFPAPGGGGGGDGGTPNGPAPK
jgi:hypothetical protein